MKYFSMRGQLLYNTVTYHFTTNGIVLTLCLMYVWMHVYS